MIQFLENQEAGAAENESPARTAFGDDILTKRTISHDEAQGAMQRLVNSHFNNPRQSHEHGRMSIPANPDRDDDLVLSAYIRQQWQKEQISRAGDSPVEFDFISDSGAIYHCVVSGPSEISVRKLAPDVGDRESIPASPEST